MNSDSGSPKLTDPVQGADSSWSTKRKFIQEGGFMVTDTELEKKGTHIITDQNSEFIVIDRILEGNSPDHRSELRRELP
jgi:hypothetical protein